MSKVSIPGFITRIDPRDEPKLEELYRRFGNARRRAYLMKQRGASKSDIEKTLQVQIGLNSRYAKDAYHSIKDLPPHITFGGLKLQRLRGRGEITKEEFHRRRNSLIISRGDKTKGGNLNARIVEIEGKRHLRINVANGGEEERWIYPELFIPKKYLERYGHLLDGRHPYSIYIKRRANNGGHDVRIVIEASVEPTLKPKRVMALDVNAGHIDFAVAERSRVVAVGRVNCHEAQHAPANKTNSLLHLTANKIKSIAEHCDASVVFGKLNTSGFRGGRRANRKIKCIPHHKLGQILEHKCGAKRRSEACTTKLGEKLSPLVGLDVHKCSAAAFALKVLDYEAFKALRSSSDEIPRGVAPDGGVGSPRRWLSAGSGLTALHQAQGLVHDEVLWDGGCPEIPGIRELSFVGSLKTGLPCLRVKIC